ncbi:MULTISPECIES: phage baseplate assembly protein V [Methylomonas]|uniref:phage baseplate assembly protein V n=1 Tax=Methylomonas TaxID=416 RepID=UPI001231B94C|nr:phage baseplate assembly protein V [Methylomonas rhizoryzae]
MNSHTLGNLHSLQLGQVTDNADPDSRGRVKVRLFATAMELWASVVVPSAGQGYGVSCIPKLDEIVVLGFISPELPLVLGSLWAGSSSAPEDADPVQDHYVLRTPEQTVLDFDDANGPKLELKTRSGYKISIDESGGGEISIERADQSVTLSSSGIAVRSSGSVTVDASSVTINASTVTVNASTASFSGIVQANTVITSSVVSASYTPGAGNIW